MTKLLITGLNPVTWALVLISWSLLGCTRDPVIHPIYQVDYDPVFHTPTYQIDYIAYGDSITEGVGDNCPGDLYKRCRGYPPKLAEMFAPSPFFINLFYGVKKSKPDFRVNIRNEGSSNQTAERGGASIEDVLRKYPEATHILIQFGTNDAHDDPFTAGVVDPTSATKFKEQMEKIIEKAMAEEKIPLLAKIPITFAPCHTVGGNECTPYGHDDLDSASGNVLIREYNVAIDQLVQTYELKVPSGCLLDPPDFYAYFKAKFEEEFESDETLNRPSEFNDYWHPNEHGYKQMARLWMEALTDTSCDSRILSRRYQTH